MSNQQPRPRVFVSSVMNEFYDMRECARRAITESGGEPVLIEDFGAVDGSPRNACLDAVASCDACIVIVGERGGFKAPSGKLVVEEEYDEARRRNLPILAYLQDRKRDAEAAALVDKISGFVDGRLRASFASGDELERLIQKNLPPIIETFNMPQSDNSNLQRLLVGADAISRGQAQLRIVVGSERSELLDALADPSNVKRFYQLAHECDLFNYELPKEPREGADSLTLVQHSMHNVALDRVEMHERGLVTVDCVLGRRDQLRDPMDLAMFGMILAVEQIEERMSAALSFVGAVFDHIDPHLRHSRMLYNAALSEYDGKLLERNPKPRNGGICHPMYRSSGPVAAFDEFQFASRDDLRHPDEIARNAADRLQRRVNASASRHVR